MARQRAKHVGLARIHYQWNDLVLRNGMHSRVSNWRAVGKCGYAGRLWHSAGRVQLAQGNAAAAFTTLAEAEQFVQQHHFDHQMGAITAVRIQIHLQQGNLAAAARLAKSQDIPLSQARVKQAQGDPSAALAALEPVRQQAKQTNGPTCGSRCWFCKR